MEKRDVLTDEEKIRNIMEQVGRYVKEEKAMEVWRRIVQMQHQEQRLLRIIPKIQERHNVGNSQ